MDGKGKRQLTMKRILAPTLLQVERRLSKIFSHKQNLLLIIMNQNGRGRGNSL